MGKKTPTPPKHMQRRTVEIRADSDGSGISGYASHFGSIDSYGTAMKKGAFAKTIGDRGGLVSVLWQHWSDSPIGKTTELREDDTGLWFNATISDGTTQGKDAMTLLRDGVPLGMSFGFETLKSRPVEEGDDLDWSQAPDFYKQDENREYVRVIEEVRLWEISVVTFPANEMATIDSVRQQEQMDALSTLLEDLRAGRIEKDDARWQQLQDVAAFTATQPEPGETTPLLSTDARRRNRQAEIALAEARLSGLISWE